MSVHNKVTKLEREAHIRTMIQFILTQSKRRGDIMQYFTAKWDMKERNIDYYIKEARKAILATTSEDRAYQIGECLAQIDDVIFKSFKINDFKTALAGIKAKIDLQGLEQPKRIALDATVKSQPDRADVIEKLTRIAEDRGISLAEMCQREGINLERYQAGEA